jgi:hypothetical protein
MYTYIYCLHMYTYIYCLHTYIRIDSSCILVRFREMSAFRAGFLPLDSSSVMSNNDGGQINHKFMKSKGALTSATLYFTS